MHTTTPTAKAAFIREMSEHGNEWDRYESDSVEGGDYDGWGDYG
jgi:hypothetical protein